MAGVQFLYTLGWVRIYISNVLAHLFTTPIPRPEDVRAATSRSGTADRRVESCGLEDPHAEQARDPPDHHRCSRRHVTVAGGSCAHPDLFTR
jgi:hypothetical protein